MELLNKNYLSIKDLQQITGIGYKASSEIIKASREIALANNYMLPRTNKLVAPTKIVRDLLKI